MTPKWKLTVWGVRGSMPVTDRDFLEYGGCTSCFSLDTGGGALIVLDAGSGLERLGRWMRENGRHRADIFISHLHLDHILGLFAFPLLQDPAAEIFLYGSPGTVRSLVHLIGPPLWPVDLTACRAKVALQECRTGEAFSPARGRTPAPPLTVTAMGGCHPGGCTYYRLDGEGRSLTYALDCETEGDTARRLASFARGTDLLIWDAHFAPGGAIPGWGHSTWREGVDLRRMAEAGRVLMTHYGGEYNDVFLRRQETLAREADPAADFAKEGMVMEL